MTVRAAAAILVAFGSMLGGCGGGGASSSGSGAGGTLTASGAITSFGSVVVNGVHYDTDTTTRFVIEGQTQFGQPQTFLKRGQVVTIVGDPRATGNPRASEVRFKRNLKGPLAKSGNTLSVLGKSVFLDSSTVVAAQGVEVTGPGGASLLVDGNVVEVSGFPDEDGNLIGARIEVDPNAGASDEVDIKAQIGSSGLSLKIGDLINLTLIAGPPSDDAVCFELTAEPVPGLPNTLVLTRVRVDNDCGLAGSSFAQAEVQGVVNRVASSSSFKVGRQPVTTDANTRYVNGTAGQIAAGTKVEVEGSISGGVLRATKVILQ